MLLSVVLGIVSANALAEWSLLASGDGKDIYVDRSTIRRSGKTVKMWDMFDYWTPQQRGDAMHYMSSKAQVEYDCINERARLLYFSNHSGSKGGGETLTDQTVSAPSWAPIAPESIVEAYWKIACGK